MQVKLVNVLLNNVPHTHTRHPETLCRSQKVDIQQNCALLYFYSIVYILDCQNSICYRHESNETAVLIVLSPGSWDKMVVTSFVFQHLGLSRKTQVTWLAIYDVSANESKRC